MRRAYGGGPRVLVSSLAELLFSFVLAPIVAVAQAVFVVGMALGRTIRWDAQLRDSRSLSWGEAWQGLWPQTLLGLALGPPGADARRRRLAHWVIGAYCLLVLANFVFYWPIWTAQVIPHSHWQWRMWFPSWI